MSGIKIIKRVKSSNIPYKGKARYDSSLPANKHDPEQGEKGAESSRRRVQHKGYKHASIVGDTQQREILPPIHNLYIWTVFKAGSERVDKLHFSSLFDDTTRWLL